MTIKNESWIYTNTSGHTISLSLGGLGSVATGISRDLLFFGSKDDIVNNESVIDSIKNGNANLKKYLNGALFITINSANIDTMLVDDTNSAPILRYSRSGESTASAALRQAMSSLGLVVDNTTA